MGCCTTTASMTLGPSHTAKMNSCPTHLFQSCNFVCPIKWWCILAAFTYTVFSVMQQTESKQNHSLLVCILFPRLIEGTSLLWGQSQMRKTVEENFLHYRRESAAEVIYHEEELFSALPGSTEVNPPQHIGSHSLLITSSILYSVPFLRASPIPNTPRSYPCARHYLSSSPFSLGLWETGPFPTFTWPNEKPFCNDPHVLHFLSLLVLLELERNMGLHVHILPTESARFLLIHLKFYEVPKQNVKRLKMNKYSRKYLCKAGRSYLNGMNAKQRYILQESYRAENHLSNAMLFPSQAHFFSYSA